MPSMSAHSPRSMPTQLRTSAMQIVHRCCGRVTAFSWSSALSDFYRSALQGNRHVFRMQWSDKQKRCQYHASISTDCIDLAWFQIRPDRGFRNDMKKLPIVCPSCGWDGLFKDYEVEYQSKTDEYSTVRGWSGIWLMLDCRPETRQWIYIPTDLYL